LIRQDNDYWILRVVDRRQARQLEFDEVRDQARRRLGQQRVDEIRAAIETELMAALGVTLVVR